MKLVCTIILAAFLSPNINFSQTILPMRFISFGLVQKGPNVLVQWSAAQEHNSKSYEIQRSYDGYDWTVAGTVAAAADGDEVKNYSFLDKHVTKTKVYYRIRHIDVDSRRSSFFTDIRSIKLQDEMEAVNIFTDIHKNIILNFYSSLNSKATIQVGSIYGQVIIKYSTANTSNFVQLSGAQLPAGTYIVSVSGNQGLITTKKIILQ